MLPHAPRPDKWISFGLAFAGGYGDAAGFVLARTFTGHVTGNLVLGAISIAAQDWRATLARLSAIVCFLAGILLSVLMARLLRARPSWPLLPTAMGVEVVLIVTAYLAFASHATEGKEMFVVCFSRALGLQNGAFRRTGGISVHTTYLTGMITNLITTGAERYAFQTASPAATPPDPRFSLIGGIWVAFVAGAGIGAAMVFHFREFGILGAALLLSALTVRNWISSDRSRTQPGKPS